MIDQKLFAAQLLPVLFEEAKTATFQHESNPAGMNQWHLYRSTARTQISDVDVVLIYFVRTARYEEPIGHYRLLSNNISFTFHVDGEVKKTRWDKEHKVPINNTEHGVAIITKTELLVLTTQEEAENDLAIIRMAI